MLFCYSWLNFLKRGKISPGLVLSMNRTGRCTLLPSLCKRLFSCDLSKRRSGYSQPPSFCRASSPVLLLTWVLWMQEFMLSLQRGLISLPEGVNESRNHLSVSHQNFFLVWNLPSGIQSSLFTLFVFAIPETPVKGIKREKGFGDAQPPMFHC